MPSTTTLPSAPSAAPSHDTERAKEVPKRTRGTWLFDNIVYTLFNNTSVFLLSTLITYKGNLAATQIESLIESGMLRDEAKKTVLNDLKDSERWMDRKVNHFLAARSDVMSERFHRHLGVDRPKADKLTMIAWSFIDGCLITPFVAVIEHFRTPAARKLDRMMGTTPDDPSVYEKEAKQTPLTIGAGRVVAFATVVPVAMALTKESSVGAHDSLNHSLLLKPGAKLGHWVESNLPSIGRTFPRLDLKHLGNVVLFEAFWTSVCTAALYLSSHYLLAGKSKAQPDAAPSIPPGKARADDAAVIASTSMGKTAPTPLPSPSRVSTAGLAVERIGAPAHASRESSFGNAGRVLAERQHADALAPAL